MFYVATDDSTESKTNFPLGTVKFIPILFY